MFRHIVTAAAVIHLTGCGYIKSLFPDKEKDYQYTTEIPSLVVPPNLSDNPSFETAAGAPEQEASASAPVAAPSDEQAAATNKDASEISQTSSAGNAGSLPADSRSEENYEEIGESGSPEKKPLPGEADALSPSSQNEVSTPPTASVQESARKTDKPLAELVVYNDGETRLQIAASKAIAWRKVGKALSRNSIEVASRDLEGGYFNVLYDPNERKFEDSSLWDEVKFIYGGIESNDHQYQLKLVENNAKTDVAVLDQDDKPPSDSTALSLLKLLQQTINTDQTD